MEIRCQLSGSPRDRPSTRLRCSPCTYLGGFPKNLELPTTLGCITEGMKTTLAMKFHTRSASFTQYQEHFLETQPTIQRTLQFGLPSFVRDKDFQESIYLWQSPFCAVLSRNNHLAKRFFYASLPSVSATSLRSWNSGQRFKIFIHSVTSARKRQGPSCIREQAVYDPLFLFNFQTWHHGHGLHGHRDFCLSSAIFCPPEMLL